MLKSICNSIYRINLRKDLWIQQLGLCSMVAEVNTKNNSEDADKISKKEGVILKVVNKSNLTKLKKHIELARAEAIISCRDTGGPYKSLNDLMSRNKLKSDVLDKLYNSISYQRYSEEISYKSAIIPELRMEQIPETTLGIHVGTSLVTWASVTNNFEVLEWDSMAWYSENPPKNSYDLITLIRPIVEKLPKCQCYVTEDTYLKNVTSTSIISCQAQLTVAIMACLKVMENQRTDDSLPPGNEIYMLKPRTSAKFHKLIVGSEIISPSYFMKKIINSNTKTSTNELEVVHINDILKHNYLHANVYHQEEISWCLLKALTFMRLALHQL
ncbi:uncharacterized protein LOC100877370 [Megachile rotundata]|uniref:uncharacterized protein LOC100877370 n=1 Tax=Megachile rotundata TaxID=143995 RepID=UPI003FD50E38